MPPPRLFPDGNGSGTERHRKAQWLSAQHVNNAVRAGQQGAAKRFKSALGHRDTAPDLAQDDLKDDRDQRRHSRRALLRELIQASREIAGGSCWRLPSVSDLMVGPLRPTPAPKGGRGARPRHAPRGRPAHYHRVRGQASRGRRRLRRFRSVTRPARARLLAGTLLSCTPATAARATASTTVRTASPLSCGPRPGTRRLTRSIEPRRPESVDQHGYRDALDGVEIHR